MLLLRGTLVGSLVGIFMTVAVPSDAAAFKIVSFDGKFTRWNSNTIHYGLDSKGSDDFEKKVTGCDKEGDCVTLQEAIRKSFDTWTDVEGSSLTFVEEAPVNIGTTGYDNKNQIVFIEKSWRALSFSPPSGALAVTISTYRTSTGEMVDSDIHFNGENFTWGAINSEAEQNSGVVVDLENIATHEIGHFIGLDHSSEDIFEPESKLYLATMFFASGPGEIFRRQLNVDDQDGAETLYPEGGAASPVVESVTPSSFDVSTTSSVSVRIVGRNFLSNSAALLAVRGDQGDVSAKIVSVTDNEITATFNVYGLGSGSYDVIVANSFDETDRLGSAVSLTGGYGAGNGTDSNDGASYSSGGGCAVSADTMAAGSGVLLLLFPIFLIALMRIEFSIRQRRAQPAPSPAKPTTSEV